MYRWFFFWEVQFVGFDDGQVEGSGRRSFLVVGAMQCMPWISLSDGFPGIYMPLLIIICIDLGIMVHEDYHR